MQLLHMLSACDQTYRSNKPLLRPDKESLIKTITQASQSLIDLGLVTSTNVATRFLYDIKVSQLSDDAFAQGARSLFSAIEMESHGKICYSTLQQFTFD